MKDKSLSQLGKLAQAGDNFALMEILKRKSYMLNKYSYNNEDLYQHLNLKVIEGIKNFKF